MSKPPPTHLLLDSQLLVLLSVGLADRSKIARHKRLSAFDARDFDLLAGIISRFPNLMVTPNIATETSNLLRFGTHDASLAEILAAGLQDWTEIYVPSRSAVQNLAFHRLGLSDAAMLHVLAEREDTILLTADVDLYLAGQSAGLAVENFNHVRNERVDFR